METKLISYDYDPEGRTITSAFRLTSPEGYSKKLTALVSEFLETSDEVNIIEFFMTKVEAGVFSGSELMALAVAGFKSPLDTMQMLRDPELLMAGMLSGMMDKVKGKKETD